MSELNYFHRALRVGSAFALSCSIIVPDLALASGQTTATYASTTTLARSATVGNDIKPASSTLKSGLDAVRRGRMKQALSARAKLRGGTLERKVLAWAIAMDGRGVDAQTLVGISQDLADWPGALTMRRNVERALAKEAGPNAMRVAFSAAQPESQAGRIALAKAHLNAGNKKQARATLAPEWHSGKLTAGEERALMKTFGSVLTRSDHVARVEYLLSKRRLRGAGRIAGKAGMTSLVKARTAVERKQRDAKSLLARVPASQRKHPNYLFSKAKRLRHANALNSAAKALFAINVRDVHRNAGDNLWTEQRILASDLLEKKAYQTAYRLAARNVATSDRKKLDAEFFAGWIALRKLGDAQTAQRHFNRLLKIAGTPISQTRGHYWMGRALEAAGSISKANQHYEQAAKTDSTYYGQLAARKLGRTRLDISKARASNSDRVQFGQYELVQAIKKLESAGHHNRARVIYRHLARHVKEKGVLALLAARAEKKRNYQLSLQVGKVAFNRGYSVDNLAWPIGAIPTKTKTSGAGLPLAYAIARQESTFQVDARSPANALGLLQLLPTTAKRTAQKIGLRYSRQRLVSDASYNARLGTAYLNQQMRNYGGSFILTFAAYNAGPGRATDWIKRNGDPRGKSLDYVIDWVELIPFSETRNYVQRVMENYQVYKARLKGGSLTIDQDLRAGRRG